MLTDDKAEMAASALHKVAEAGREIELVRGVLVRRAEVALAAGADERAVAKAAGVQVMTLRRWLTHRAS